MDIETNREKKELSYTELLDSSQVVVECDIDMDSRDGVTRVLSATGNVIPTKIEPFVGEAKVYGKVLFKVLYLNKEEALSSVEYCSDFVSSVTNTTIDTTSILSAKMCLKDIDNAIRGTGVRLQAVVDVNLYAVAKREVEVVTDVSNALVKRQDMQTSIHICHINELVDVGDTYDTGSNVDKILSLDTSLSISNAKAGEDNVTVIGEANVSILYMSEGKLATKNLTIPYSEDIKCFGVNKSCVALLNGYVSDSKLVLGGMEDDNTMDIRLTLDFIGDVYEYNTTSVVEDVYSPCHELKIDRKATSFEQVIEYKCSNERINGETSIEDDIAKIVGAFAMPCAMTNVNVEDTKIGVEALIDTCIVYIDENGECHSLALELPASFTISSENVKACDRVYVDIVTCNIMAKAKRDHDIDVSLDVAVELYVMRTLEQELVENVESIAECQNKHKAMSIYFVKKGDTMWNIMKSVGASSEDIVRMNGDIDFEHLTGGERVIVYRGIS